MLSCTLEGVHGDCDGALIPSRVLGTGGELCGGRGALKGCLLRRGVYWLRWWPHKIYRGGHRVLGG